MKTKSTSRSAFFIPRVVLGGVLCSAGVFLAVAALNKTVAETPARKATPTQPGTWTATGSMSIARRGFTATLLANGKVDPVRVFIDTTKTTQEKDDKIRY